MRINPDFACHANNRFSPANITFEIQDSLLSRNANLETQVIYIYDDTMAIYMDYSVDGGTSWFNEFTIDTAQNILNIGYNCDILDEFIPTNTKHREFIDFVNDRPGHDKRYAIDSNHINTKIGWKPKYEFEESLRKTVEWYLNNISWCESILSTSSSFIEK